MFDIPPVLQTILIGTSALGAVSGAIGCLAVVRRESLVGDAISHAALPGIALGFLLGGDSLPTLLGGAMVSGWVTVLAARWLADRTRLPFETLLGGGLSVMFGLGLVLMKWIQKHVPGSGEAGLDRWLFGQAAAMSQRDLRAIASLGVASVSLILLFWKELKLTLFDPEYAAGIGLPVKWIERLKSGLIVVAVVIGLQSVGVVLMSALLVAPGVAARQWTDRLGRMLILGALFGATFGAMGSLASWQWSLPTGPAIVLCAILGVILSLPATARR